MNYVKSLNIIGVEAKEIPCIVGNGAPSDTDNATGLLYMDEDSGEIYKRTATGWVLLVPQSPNIIVTDSIPTDLTDLAIGDIVFVKES